MDSIYKILESLDQVSENTQIDSNKISKLLKDFDQSANEFYRAYGDVDTATVVKALQQGNVDAAIDAVSFTYAGPKGEEPGRGFDDALEELEDEFKHMVSKKVEEDMSADDINIEPIDHSDDDDGASVEDISSAITRRLMAHPKFGALVREIDIIDLNDAIEDIAQFHAGGDLGTSDVSSMVNDVLKQLKKEGALDESEDLSEMMGTYKIMKDGKVVATGVRATSEQDAVKQAYMKMGSASKYTGAGMDSFKAVREEQEVNEEEVEENAFIKSRLDAIKAGKDSFEVDGKTYKVTGDTSDEKMTEDYDKDEYDEEGEMAKNQLDVACDATKELKAMIEDDENLPEWVQKKITLAMDYLDTARDYLKSVDDDMETTDEVEFALEESDTMQKISRKFMKAMSFGPQTDSPKDMQAGISKMSDKELLDLMRGDDAEAPSGSARSLQQKLLKREIKRRGIGESEDLEERKLSSSEEQEMERIVTAMKDDPETVQDMKKRYGKRWKEVAYATATKMAKQHGKGTGNKKKTDETTVAGAVATGADATGSNIYGNPSVYESMNSSVENMITESMNVSVNSSNDPSAEPSVTVSATGEDAMALAQLLQLAAVDRPKTMKVCKHCGDQMGKPVHMDCPYDNRDPMGENFMEVACEDEEANSANNTETYDMEYLLNAISGGLNRQKRQINPNNPGDNPMAMDPNKTVNVEESEDVGVSHLEALYQEFKTR